VTTDTDALLATVREAIFGGPGPATAALASLAAELELVTRSRDEHAKSANHNLDVCKRLEAELERVKAERDGLIGRNQFLSTEQVRADVNAALLDKALAALQEIETAIGTSTEFVETIMRRIARAAIAEIEGEA
jgi:hypothetical protein